MKTLPVVAIIGPTNAGKSTLLNRLARKNIAITAREAGTTRDNVIATLYRDHFSTVALPQLENNTQEGRKKGERVPLLRLVDTAGLKDPEDTFEQSIQHQITDAIETADLILVLLDSTQHPDDKTLKIIRQTQRSHKPYIIALNKTDLRTALPDTAFRHFGEKTPPLRLSATTGQGIPELKNALEENLQSSFSSDCSPAKTATYIPDGTDKVAVGAARLQSLPASQRMTSPDLSGSDKKETLRFSPDAPLKIALIGRPNVGKSSLFNALSEKQQALVSSHQGTTRDINRVDIKFKGRTLEFLDTAGLRKPGKREVGIEKFSALRTLAAIEESDLCLLLVDATEPHSKLDQSLAGQITTAGKSIILVVTKSDLLEQNGQDELLDSLERDFNFLPYAPVIITSSQQGKNLTKIFDLSLEITTDRHTELKTSDLNQLLEQTTKTHPPAGLKNTKPKLRYITQTDTNPPWFVIYGSNLQQLHWSYKRHLESQIRRAHPYTGTPIFLSFKNRDPKK